MDILPPRYLWTIPARVLHSFIRQWREGKVRSDGIDARYTPEVGKVQMVIPATSTLPAQTVDLKMDLRFTPGRGGGVRLLVPATSTLPARTVDISAHEVDRLLAVLETMKRQPPEEPTLRDVLDAVRGVFLRVHALTDALVRRGHITKEDTTQAWRELIDHDLKRDEVLEELERENLSKHWNAEHLTAMITLGRNRATRREAEALRRRLRGLHTPIRRDDKDVKEDR
jgi:polyhydroxyalkanoate synthesis regulator phasin